MKTNLASADDRFDFLEWGRVCQCGALTLRSRASTTHDCHLWLLCELSERVIRRSVACWGGGLCEGKRSRLTPYQSLELGGSLILTRRLPSTSFTTTANTNGTL